MIGYIHIVDVYDYRAPVSSAEAGQCVSLALKRVRRSTVRKGMVIVHKTDTRYKDERQANKK